MMTFHFVQILIFTAKTFLKNYDFTATLQKLEKEEKAD
jgi:hypothetical protein